MKQEISTVEDSSLFLRQEIESLERMMAIRTDRSIPAVQKKRLLTQEMESHIKYLFGGSE